MGSTQELRIGIVGACARGRAFRKALQDRQPHVHLAALCDIDGDALAQAVQSMGAERGFCNFEEMFNDGDIDAVIIASPMHLHARQSVAALECGLHVLSEVTPAVTVEECRQLVRAATASTGIYMLAENCNYTTQSLVVGELVRRGLFGTCYYAEAEYLHEVKELNERTPWRRKWQTGIDGITYGTHSLGPVLSWLAGDRVTEVSCAGSGSHYTDPRGDAYHQDTSVMLCRLASGGLIKVRVDMTSERPPVTTTYQLQGTGGCYESARRDDEGDRVWLRELTDDPHCWLDLDDLVECYLPASWRERPVGTGGHSGSDERVTHAFINAVIDGKSPQPGIHEAMDMTLPGLVSQRAVASRGWEPVPNSRGWVPENEGES
ncbi:MAG: Gfo/Idh/MocA family oxidoreductase [Candidatus Latescibacterota bacterium]|nr:Gfo/Idh/MocA family oxidoreductase [Candidatus Latescibacterota bacterium]